MNRPLPTLVRSVLGRLNLFRRVANLEARMTAATPSADREIVALLAASLPAILDSVDALKSDRDQWRTRALEAEGAAATDQSDDIAALAPLQDGLSKLRDKLAPAAETSDPLPIDDVPAAVDAAPAPAESGTEGDTTQP